MKKIPDTSQGWERVVSLTVTAALTVLLSWLIESDADLSLKNETSIERGFVHLEDFRQAVIYYEDRLSTCDCEE